MRLCAFYVVICLYSIEINLINCWESFEPDLFDLVEEVGQNFYEFFGISQNADVNEVKKAYRKLSMKWHPDKNSEPDAEQTFRKIVGIYEVLKDDIKRKRYNEILEFGLPDWRQPIYYYRRVRKLTITELSLAISVIIVIGHYFVMWAQYFENKLCLDERISEARKKLEKKQKKKNKNADMDEIDKALNQAYDLLEVPSIKKTLPIRFLMWLYTNKLFVPILYESIKEKFRKRNLQSKESDINDDDSDLNESTDSEEIKRNEERRRIINELNPKKIETSNLSKPVIPYENEKYKNDISNEDNDNEIKNESNSNKKFLNTWTDSEKSLLIKAISKYPSGTADRWNAIAKYVQRPVQQCIQMEKFLRINYQQQICVQNKNLVINTQQFISDDLITQRESYDDSLKDADNKTQQLNDWTQEQQKQLEEALKQFGKDIGKDRWDKIAQLVPGKTKEECMQRFKTLCQAINKNKK